MLAAYCNKNDETTKCASLLGTVTPQHQESGGLISENTSLLAPDVSGDCTDTCSFYSGPSDATIMAFGESCKTNGSIAYYGGEAVEASLVGAVAVVAVVAVIPAKIKKCNC